MPFCVNCGAQNRDAARFCESCGKPVTQLVQGAGQQQPVAQPPPVVQRTASPTKSMGMARTLALAGVGIYGAAAVLTIMGGNMMDFIISLALAAGIYLAVYARLAKGNVDAAKKGALAAGVAALIFVLFSFINGAPVAALFNALAAACMGLTWNSIKS